MNIFCNWNWWIIWTAISNKFLNQGIESIFWKSIKFIFLHHSLQYVLLIELQWKFLLKSSLFMVPRTLLSTGACSSIGNNCLFSWISHHIWKLKDKKVPHLIMLFLPVNTIGRKAALLKKSLNGESLLELYDSSTSWKLKNLYRCQHYQRYFPQLSNDHLRSKNYKRFRNIQFDSHIFLYHHLTTIYRLCHTYLIVFLKCYWKSSESTYVHVR